MYRNKKGFTLVEVIVVLVILAILIAIAVPSIMKYIDDANDAKLLAQARPVLNTSKAEAAKLYADGTLESLPMDKTLHEKIMKIADIEGDLIEIKLNAAQNSSGDFIVKIKDRYIYYNDKKQTFTFIENIDLDDMSSQINNALRDESVMKNILDYFQNHTNTFKLDSEGPNFGMEIKKLLTDLGFDDDLYSFRIWHKNVYGAKENSITIGAKLTLDMVGQEVEVIRYDYGASLDFTSEPVIRKAKVKIEQSETTDKNGAIVKYPVFKLDDAKWE